LEAHHDEWKGLHQDFGDCGAQGFLLVDSSLRVSPQTRMNQFFPDIPSELNIPCGWPNHPSDFWFPSTTRLSRQTTSKFLELRSLARLSLAPNVVALPVVWPGLGNKITNISL